jgi:tRNA threonylcarbamoyladenosine biosynthesis protein TsaE
MEIIAVTKEQTEEFSHEIAKVLKSGDVVALYGDLGAGKTAFTGMLVKSLGFSDRVQSPTFVISRIYTKHPKKSEFETIYHIDLYRMHGASEIKDLGLEEYINTPGALTIIEWPEVGEKYLPQKTIRIFFEVMEGDERKIHVQNLR